MKLQIGKVYYGLMTDGYFNLLFVDDDPNIISFLKRVFRKTDYNLFTVESGAEALSVISNYRIDAAIVDMKMPGLSGIELLKIIKKRSKGTEVIILTGHGAIDSAVQAIKSGAFNFIEKPAKNELLLSTVANIASKTKLINENKFLKDQMDFNIGFEQLLGLSKPMLELKKMIKKISTTEASVLITGETGTGKELIARAIHKNSKRKEGPFVTVDCASINENMIEGELFGHIKGAFTGAINSSPGLVRAADNGTLFLDEISEMPNNLQAKLLRVIQQREVRPVGGTRNYKVNIRIIAASNRNLTEEISKDNFREDLYYRLNVVNLKAPPLRERGEDLAILTKYFINKFSIPDQNFIISEAGMMLLSKHKWLGNVRELENIIRRMIAISDEGTIPDDLISREIGDSNKEEERSRPAESVDNFRLDQHEKNAIIKALNEAGGNRSRTAELLQISEATLYRKLNKYSLHKI